MSELPFSQALLEYRKHFNDERFPDITWSFARFAEVAEALQAGKNPLFGLPEESLSPFAELNQLFVDFLDTDPQDTLTGSQLCSMAWLLIYNRKRPDCRVQVTQTLSREDDRSFSLRGILILTIGFCPQGEPGDLGALILAKVDKITRPDVFEDWLLRTAILERICPEKERDILVLKGLADLRDDRQQLWLEALCLMPRDSNLWSAAVAEYTTTLGPGDWRGLLEFLALFRQAPKDQSLRYLLCQYVQALIDLLTDDQWQVVFHEVQTRIAEGEDLGFVWHLLTEGYSKWLEGFSSSDLFDSYCLLSTAAGIVADTLGARLARKGEVTEEQLTSLLSSSSPVHYRLGIRLLQHIGGYVD